MFFNLIKEINRLLSNVFELIKEINRLRKEINSLLSKGMSNIYLKVTIETFSKSTFLGFKNWTQGQFWVAPTHTDIKEFQNLLFQLKNSSSGRETVSGFPIILILKGVMTF